MLLKKPGEQELLHSILQLFSGEMSRFAASTLTKQGSQRVLSKFIAGEQVESRLHAAMTGLQSCHSPHPA